MKATDADKERPTILLSIKKAHTLWAFLMGNISKTADI
jgi:hypothetical protein